MLTGAGAAHLQGTGTWGSRACSFSDCLSPCDSSQYMRETLGVPICNLFVFGRKSPSTGLQSACQSRALIEVGCFLGSGGAVGASEAGAALGQCAGPRQLGGQCLSTRPPHSWEWQTGACLCRATPLTAAAVNTTGRAAQSCSGPRCAIQGWGPARSTPGLKPAAGGGEDDIGQETAGREQCQPQRDPPRSPCPQGQEGQRAGPSECHFCPGVFGKRSTLCRPEIPPVRSGVGGGTSGGICRAARYDSVTPKHSGSARAPGVSGLLATVAPRQALPVPSFLTEQGQPGISLSSGWGPIFLGSPGTV